MIKTIDLLFQGMVETIAAYVLETEEGPVLFETGPHSTLPILESGLKDLGYTTKDVRHVFLTHVHLDHAGGAWYFAEQGAKVYVHPKGVKHLHSPERLMASAARIYKDMMDQLWGEMKAIPLDHLLSTEDLALIKIGEHEIIGHHTPGHAVHHIAWQIGKDLICGDVGGIKIKDGPVVPPCPPPDINVEDWQESISRLRSLNPERLHLTHFGTARANQAFFDQLEEKLLKWSMWMKGPYLNQEDPKELSPRFMAFVQQELMELGVAKSEAQKYEMANPSWMSVAGLMRYWKKKLE